ncbi:MULTISPECIES: hypothetical protein [Candidatus Nitrosocaldus]|nr:MULTISPECIES: hypothetical protein [Candidatus Nitrosocaldus]
MGSNVECQCVPSKIKSVSSGNFPLMMLLAFVGIMDVIAGFGGQTGSNGRSSNLLFCN